MTSTDNTVDEILDTRYGDLQGASLSVELLDPIVVSKATRSSQLIPTNAKSNFMLFCSKNKINLPTFTRCSENGRNGYVTEAKWNAPDSDGTGPVVFIEKGEGATKREAEGDAALKLQTKIEVWLESHKPVELGNFKGELQDLVVKHSNRFPAPKYVTEQSKHDLSYFNCSLSVTDLLTGEYSTNGSGVGKKVAEKDAARKMLIILREIIESTPPIENSKDDIEKLQTNIDTAFPGYRLEYIPIDQETESVRYLVKTCSLVLKKENRDSIVVAICSGLEFDDARLACARLALQYFRELRQLMD